MMGLFSRLLSIFAGSFFVKALGGVGLGVFSYSVISTKAEEILGYAISNLEGLPSDVLSLLGLLGFDQYLSIVLSAVVFRVYIISMKVFLSKTT